MSLVTLIIIRGKRLTIVTQHYRVIQHAIMKAHTIVSVKNSPTRKLDEGYIIYDLNRQSIINAQRAFVLPHIPGVEVTEVWS